MTVAFVTTAPVASLTVPCRSAAFDCAWPKATLATARVITSREVIRHDLTSHDLKDTNIAVFSLTNFRDSGTRAVTQDFVDVRLPWTRLHRRFVSDYCGVWE